MSWTTLDKLGTELIQFLITIVLARLLMPSDYGIIGMLAIFIAISDTLLDSGFGNALIQKKDRTETDYSTVFYFNIVIGIVLYLILFVSAPWIANFYDMPILTDVLRVYMLTIIIHSLCIVQVAKLKIDLRFKVITLVSLPTIILTGFVGIVFAYHGFGVWALVYQALAQSLFRCGFLWWFAHWKPHLVFSVQSFQQLFSFGSKLLASSLINTVYSNIYTLVIGKTFSSVEVGYFNRANHFVYLPSKQTKNIVLSVSFPILTRMQDNRENLLNAYSKMVTVPMTLLFPLMIDLAILASPIVSILIGDKWLPSVYIMQILAIGYMFSPLSHINLNLLYVKGRSDLVLRLELIKKAFGFLILFSTLPFGIFWMIIGKAFYGFLAFVFNCYFTKKILDYGFWEQMKSLLPILVRSVLMGVLVWFVAGMCDNNWVKVIIGFFVSGVSYISLCWVMHDSTFLELRKMLFTKVRNSQLSQQ